MPDTKLKELLTQFKDSSYSMKLDNIPLLEYDFTDEEWRCLVTLLFKDVTKLKEQMQCNESFYRYNINSLLAMLKECNKDNK